MAIHYTVSIGVAAMDADVKNINDLMKRADAAMYAAKANGRNRVERWRKELPLAPNASPAV